MSTAKDIISQFYKNKFPTYKDLIKSVVNGDLSQPYLRYALIKDYKTWAVKIGDMEVVFLNDRSAHWYIDYFRQIKLNPWRLKRALRKRGVSLDVIPINPYQEYVDELIGQYKQEALDRFEKMYVKYKSHVEKPVYHDKELF